MFSDFDANFGEILDLRQSLNPIPISPIRSNLHNSPGKFNLYE